MAHGHSGKKYKNCPICKAKKKANERWHIICHVAEVAAVWAFVAFVLFSLLFR
jgi:hypothetical protein